MPPSGVVGCVVSGVFPPVSGGVVVPSVGGGPPSGVVSGVVGVVPSGVVPSGVVVGVPPCCGGNSGNSFLYNILTNMYNAK